MSLFQDPREHIHQVHQAHHTVRVPTVHVLTVHVHVPAHVPVPEVVERDVPLKTSTIQILNLHF